MAEFSLDGFVRAVGSGRYGLTIRNCIYMESRRGWEGAKGELQEHLLVVMERGVMDLRIEGKPFLLRKGEVCWLRPGTVRGFVLPHEVDCAGSWRLRFSLGSKKQTCNISPGPHVREDASALVPYLMLLRETLEDEELLAGVRPLLQAVLLRFMALRKVSQKKQGSRLDAVQRRRIDLLLQRELLGGVSPADMAKAAGLSADYFTRVFGNTYGVSPRRYLLEQRMRLAGDILLDSVLTIDELCREIGESDAGTFCRQFKKVLGLTPTEYRRKYGAAIIKAP